MGTSVRFLKSETPLKNLSSTCRYIRGYYYNEIIGNLRLRLGEFKPYTSGGHKPSKVLGELYRLREFIEQGIGSIAEEQQAVETLAPSAQENKFKIKRVLANGFGFNSVASLSVQIELTVDTLAPAPGNANIGLWFRATGAYCRGLLVKLSKIGRNCS